jgi:peptidyl-prolyl cis-trans isomerase A (cyclophilin A)
MQFLVTDGSALHLDGSYTIFGECGPIERVHQIAAVEADRGTPREPVLIRTVRIERPAPGASATASPATAAPPAATATPAPQASP